MILRKRIHPLFFSLLVIASIVPGCGPGQTTRAPARLPPTKTAVPTPTADPIPTALPLPSAASLIAPTIVLDGWQDIVVTHLCLEYTLEGISPIPDSLNIEATLVESLEAYGIQMSTDENDDCDGTLTVEADVAAIRASYTPGGACYSGASVNIGISLVAQGQQANLRIANKRSPPTNINSCAKDPQDAPFASLWRCDLFETLGQIWGTSYYVANLANFRLARERAQCAVPTDEAIDLVLAKLGDPIGDPGSYRAALELISHWRLVEAAPYLHAYIHTPELHPFTVFETAQTLSDLGELTEEDLPPVIALVQAGKSAESDPAPLFRSVTPPEAAIPPLLNALEGASSGGRAIIARALAYIGEPAYPYVIPMLEDHQTTRDAIVTSLGYQDYTVIAPLLSFAAQAERPVVQEAVTSIVGKVSDHEFEDLEACQDWWQEMGGQMSGLQPDDFATALASNETVLRQYTLEQIVELDSPPIDTLPILTDMLSSERGHNQSLVTLALGGMGPEGLDAINSYLGSSNITPGIRTVCAALASMGPDALDSVPTLIENLSKEDTCNPVEPVYPAIVQALISITGENLGCDADAWQAWWNENH